MSVSRILAGLRPRLWRPLFWRGNASSAGPETQATGPEPPNGFLFNEKVMLYLKRTMHWTCRFYLKPTCLCIHLLQPLLPGEKRQKESWENVWVYSMTFNLLLVIAICTLKPDTRCTHTHTDAHTHTHTHNLYTCTLHKHTAHTHSYSS